MQSLPDDVTKSDSLSLLGRKKKKTTSENLVCAIVPCSNSSGHLFLILILFFVIQTSHRHLALKDQMVSNPSSGHRAEEKV